MSHQTIGAAATPLPTDPPTQFAEWRKTIEYRLKNMEGHRGSDVYLVDESSATSDSPALGSTGIDHALTINGAENNGIWVANDRSYEVRFHGQMLTSAGSVWAIECRQQYFNDLAEPPTVTDSPVGRFGLVNIGGAGFAHVDGTVSWKPLNSGRYQVYLRTDLVSGSGTITMTSTATSSINTTRYIKCWDIGPRL